MHVVFDCGWLVRFGFGVAWWGWFDCCFGVAGLQREGAVVVCFSEVWCLGLLDDFLVWFARCFCVDWCLDSRMWLVVLLRNLFVAVVVA